MKRYILCLAILNVFFVCITNAQMITTIAGGGTAGLGDGGAAIDCELFQPYFTALSLDGSIYVADAGNNRIRKINNDGKIITVAGTGVAGYNGDNILATDAQLNDPLGVAIDNYGNLFISDNANQRIRRIDASGKITTIAGTGSPGYNGDGISATSAELYSPHGIAIDKTGNIYVCDVLNERIRKISPSGIISTCAGTGSSGVLSNGIATATAISQPFDVVTDESGSVFFTSPYANRVCHINSTGMLNIIAGTTSFGYNGDNISASTAQLHNPFGIALDGSGNVYVADVLNVRVRKIDKAGVISTVAGKGTTGFAGDGGLAIDAEMKQPLGISVDKYGSLYITDYGNERLRYVRNAVGLGSAIISNEKIAIYPCPSSDGRFILRISSEPKAIFDVQITDAIGQVVKKLPVPTNEDISISLDRPSGMYSIIAESKQFKELRTRILIYR